MRKDEEFTHGPGAVAALPETSCRPAGPVRTRNRTGAVIDTVADSKTHSFLVSTLAVILSAGVSLPALADGGAGGKGAGITSGAGSAGTTNTTTAGGEGGLGVLETFSGTVGGSGGGGAGSTGGAGGQSQILVAVGCCDVAASPNGGAGTGGATPGANGGDGADGSDITRTTGGGGGGGAHGAVLTATTSDTGATGGNGGNGGYAGYTMGGGGGGGGGYGVVIDGVGLTYTNTGTVAGGTGGAGGNASIYSGGYGSGGDGGDGGIGVYFTGSGTLNNSGSIVGGAGGDGGSAVLSGGTNGAAGTDGAGVVGSNLTIVNSGSITGGGSADAITFTGGTNALSLGAAGTITGNIAINGGGSLLLDQTGNSATLSSAITGNGSVTVTAGSNTLTLNGSSTYTGTTTVSSGTLAIGDASHSSASLTSNVTVNSGASLRGHGTINGSVTFNNGSSFTVDASPTQGSRLDVTGTASIGSNVSVNVVAENGTYSASTQYTVLNASGGVSGTFASVSSNLAFLDPTLSYGANNVTLTLARNNTGFTAVATTGNQRSVAGALNAIDTAGPSGDMQTLVTALTGLSASGARQTYDSLSGVQHTNAQALLLGSGGQLARLLGARTMQLSVHPGAISTQASAFTPVQLAFNGDLSELQLAMNDTGAPVGDGSEGSGVWLMPRGGFGTIDDTANASGATYHDYGFYGGADRWLDNERLVGWSLGYTRTEGSPDAGAIRLDSVELALYGRRLNNDNYFDASVSAGYHQNNNSRQVTVGPLVRTASSDYSARSATLTAEVGRTLPKSGTLQLTPFVGMSYSRIERSAFSESGAGAANLQVARSNQDSLRSSLGLRVTNSQTLAGGASLDTDFEAAWVHEFGDRAATLSAAFSGAPTTEFLIDGPALDRDRVRLGAGVISRIGEATTLRLGYQGELADSDTHHTFSATFRMPW